MITFERTTYSVSRWALVVACLVAAASMGCTSMKTIDPVTEPAAPAFGRVAPGDTVIVRLRDGRRERFVVQEIDADAIVARGGARYLRDDIVQLQRRSFSGAKTALLVGGTLAGIVAVVSVATALALGGILGGS